MLLEPILWIDFVLRNEFGHQCRRGWRQLRRFNQYSVTGSQGGDGGQQRQLQRVVERADDQHLDQGMKGSSHHDHINAMIDH